MFMLSLSSQISALLAEVERPGCFCASGTLRTPLPDLKVEGVGQIAMPLLPVQAEALAAVAERAPYGRGDQTLLDEEVRRAWQLAPSQLKFDGDVWPETMAKIVAQVREELGVKGTIDAELYKMLLYEPGDFFTEHRDTEKSPGMFATLVVVLPSVFEGGALVVRHAEQQERLALRSGSISEVSWGAFYADCRHELEPLTSGHRLCLIYNLVRRSPDGPLGPPDQESPVRQVAAALRAWPQGGGEPQKLLCLLDHAYTLDGLSFSGLKNKDRAVGEVLVKAAAQADCDLFLAMVSIEESGVAEYDDGYGRGRWDEDEDDLEAGEVYERDLRIEGWRSHDGSLRPMGALSFDESELCPPGALQDEKPDELHFMEATGNEGASFTRAYRRAAFVMWPSPRRHAHLISGGPGVSVPHLKALVAGWRAAGSAPQHPQRDEALALCAALIDTWPASEGASMARSWRRGEEKCRSEILDALVALGEPALIERFIDRVMSGDALQEGEIEALLASARSLGWEAAGPALEALVTRQMPAGALACAKLLRAMGDAPEDDAALRRAQLSVASALVAKLPREHRDVPRSNAWGKPDTVISDLVVVLVSALIELDEPEISERAARHITDHPRVFGVDQALIPALCALLEQLPISSLACALVRHLQRACSAWLDARVAQPLEEPSDWTQQTAALKCRCEDCRGLAAFMTSPTEQVWHLRARQDRRDHLESQILNARLDMDCTTSRKGNPHTLVCTKNRRTYKQHLAQRQVDLEHLALMARIP